MTSCQLVLYVEFFENWVQGNKHVLADRTIKDIRGDYELKVAGKTYTMNLSGKMDSPKAKIKKDSVTLSSKISYQDDWLNLSFSEPNEGVSYVTKALISKDSVRF